MKSKYSVIGTVKSLDQIYEGRWYKVAYGPKLKTVHGSFLLSQQTRALKKLVQGGNVMFAERLTNREYYGELTVEAVSKKLGNKLCERCERYRDQHDSCDPSCLERAVMDWMEDEVE